MQFHLNGVTKGDPSVLPPLKELASPDRLPSEVDVLIVGSGPTGLTLAAQLAAFPHIRTCLIECKPERLTLGQADGIACRTMEMFEAFGFSDQVRREAYWVNETTFWKPDPSDTARIARSGRIEDTPYDLSHQPHVILNQARVHDFFLEHMYRSVHRAVPYYSRRLRGLTVAPSDSAPFDTSAYPVTAEIERVDPEHSGEIETVRARFVVGCDGARSTVRQTMGLSLDGESANQAWGVMDVLAVTDFPDIRLKTAIHSQNAGSILIIPREGGYLTRLYIELDELRPGERVSDRDITIGKLIASAKRILDPFQLEVKEVAWWSAYEIGQRLCARFDDVPAEQRGTRLPRVFIAGDACHTHSPKAGQGMNVSMQDAFNLGWKLASVLSGQVTPGILDSYSLERHAVAKELIDFDKDMARLFSAAPKDPNKPEDGGIDPAEFQAFFEAQGRFTAGTATRYGPSLISGEAKHQNLAKGLVQGMRFHSSPVVRLCDAKSVELGTVLEADGRWRIIAFAPDEDAADPAAQIQKLCAFLAESDRSPVRRFTRKDADIDSVIDLRAVFQDYHRDLELDCFPAILKPTKGRYGLVDYEKIFCADRGHGRDIFDRRGIDRARGCVVIVRPDQYVAQILPTNDHDAIFEFFGGFMIEAGGRSSMRRGPLRQEVAVK